jgi:hypothetical protein
MSATIYNHLQTLKAFTDSAVPQVAGMARAILKAFQEDPRNPVLPSAVSLFDALVQTNLDHMADGVAMTGVMCGQDHPEACAGITRGWAQIRGAWLSQARILEELLVLTGNVACVEIGAP